MFLDTEKNVSIPISNYTDIENLYNVSNVNIHFFFPLGIEILET